VKKLGLFFLACLAYGQTIPAPGPGVFAVAATTWPNGYTSQYAFTIQSGQVPATQSNFPLLVCPNGSNGCNLTITGLGAQFESSSCYDAIWTADSTGSSSASNLPFELVANSCNTSTGQVEWWVSPSSVTAGMTIYLYVGNASVTTNQGWPTTGSSPWPSFYQAVYHMGGQSTLNTNDSTGNGNNGSGNVDVSATTGNIEGAVAFANNNTQKVDVGNGSTLNFTGNVDYAFEMWVNNQDTNTNWVTSALLSKYIGTGPNGYSVYATHACGGGYNTFFLDVFSAGTESYFIVGANFLRNTWYHLVVTVFGGVAAIYVNGVSQSDCAESGSYAVGSVSNDLWLGARDDTSTYPMDGYLDEVRISHTIASNVITANWVSLEYNNQSSQSAFWSVVGPTLP